MSSSISGNFGSNVFISNATSLTALNSPFKVYIDPTSQNWTQAAVLWSIKSLAMRFASSISAHVVYTNIIHTHLLSGLTIALWSGSRNVDINHLQHCRLIARFAVNSELLGRIVDSLERIPALRTSRIKKLERMAITKPILETFGRMKVGQWQIVLPIKI